MADETVKAHTQELTLHLLEFFPSHEPRAHDPHYASFNAARKKMKAAGKLVCWICGKDEAAAGVPVQLHHSRVEFALANGIDVEKFIHNLPELNIHNEEEFFEWCESEGNLQALCPLHHVGIQGIHLLPYPSWVAQKWWKAGLPAPTHAIRPNKDD